MTNSRTANFREVEVLFQNVDEAREMTGKKLMSEKRVIFSTYMGMRLVGMGVGNVSPSIQKELVLRAVLNGSRRGQVLQMSQSISGGIVWNSRCCWIKKVAKRISEDRTTSRSVEYDSRWQTFLLFQVWAERPYPEVL